MLTGRLGRRRTIALLGIFALVFLSLIGRMVFLQIVSGDYLNWKAFTYRMRPVPIQADRGEILDRNGQPLLTNKVCESVYAEPILIKSKPAAAQALAPILEMKPEELETRMNRPSFFEWLKRKVAPEVVAKVKALGIPGIGLASEKCRYYPEGSLAVHVLGIANLDHLGIEGLELTYDKYLAGKPGAIQCEYTARGMPMKGGNCVVNAGAPGLTLQTTIDIGLQRMLEKEVERAHIETSAKRATIMVMEVKTGEILGLAQWPHYDPALGGNSDPASRRIFTVADTLPPGSIFKPTTAAAALQSGVANKNTQINDTGCLMVGSWKICNWDHKGLGTIGLDVVMAKSSNVGFATLGKMLGKENFYTFHDLFGFTRPTGIDLPGEAVGQWIPKKSASEVDLAVQAYGQTLTVSPIQMLTAIGAIANDGKRMWPHLGKALLDKDGRLVKQIQPRVAAEVVSPQVAKQIQEWMVGVTEFGTGRNARVPGYKVAGKTGTATKVIGGKLSNEHIASFVGFAPYPDPRVVVLISLDEPQGKYYGGEVAAPIFGELMGSVLSYLDAPRSSAPPPPPEPGQPAPQPAPVPATVPNLVNLPIEQAKQVAEAAGFTVILTGAGGYVTSQFPLPGAQAYREGTIRADLTPPVLKTEQVRVPDLRGKSLIEAASLLAQRGLFMTAAGTGIVAAQTPAAGTLVKQGTVLDLRLETPLRR
jgi:stage V sporulation protein D (sporulation-specific penicillin-binding protein)